MNKICGYTCEHNKGGVCQITICDKQPYMTTTTITNDNSCGIRISNEDISTSTGKIIINGVEITDVKSWEKVISTLEEKNKEIERLNNIINLIKNNIDITIQIIKEQPTGNDEWILERLNGIKNIGELKEGK